MKSKLPVTSKKYKNAKSTALAKHLADMREGLKCSPGIEMSNPFQILSDFSSAHPRRVHDKRSSIVERRRLEMMRKQKEHPDPLFEELLEEEKAQIDGRVGLSPGVQRINNAYFGEPNPLDRQVGGSHYKDYPIQPIKFMVKNKLSFIVGSVIKYLCRYNKQGGKGLQDLEKCIHYIELLIEIEGWRKK